MGERVKKKKKKKKERANPTSCKPFTKNQLISSSTSATEQRTLYMSELLGSHDPAAAHVLHNMDRDALCLIIIIKNLDDSITVHSDMNKKEEQQQLQQQQEQTKNRKQPWIKEEQGRKG